MLNGKTSGWKVDVRMFITARKHSALVETTTFNNKILTEGGYCIFTISPKSIFTYARYFWGHRIYPRNEAQIEEQIRSLNFTILGKTKTLLQNQYLIQK